MSDKVKAVLLVVGLIVSVMLIDQFSRGYGLATYSFWGTKTEDAKREVFEHSKSFVDGQIHEIRDMQVQYVQASPAHRDALRSLILTRVDSVNPETLPQDLQQFVSELRLPSHETSLDTL